MRRTFKKSLIASLILVAVLGKKGSADPAESTEVPGVAVYVSDYAAVGGTVLDEACKIATGIFQQAGVEALFVFRSENDRWDSLTATLPQLCRFYVSILTKEKAAALGWRRNKLGFVPGDATDDQRRFVYIVDHVADKLVRKNHQADKARVLGYAMAHELGHLLLLRNSHSLLGIMRARWDENDMLEMARSTLTFLSAEARQIRAEVERRNRMQSTIMLAAR